MPRAHAHKIGQRVVKKIRNLSAHGNFIRVSFPHPLKVPASFLFFAAKPFSCALPR